MFTDEENASILSDFPKFELSYEIITHKKVFNHNVILAIPEGIKCFAWFTSYRDENVCFIMEINDNRQIEHIHIRITGFHDNLTMGDYGTILYGTLYKWKGCSCFCIEDLYFYKGVNYSNHTFLYRLKLLKTILHNEISQNIITKNSIIFGLPIMNTDLLVLLREIDNLPYKISMLKYRWFETKKIICAYYYKPRQTQYQTQTQLSKPYNTDPLVNSQHVTLSNNNNNNNNNKLAIKNTNTHISSKQLSYAIFKITADIQSDIYNLFSIKDGKDDFYDYAFIPDYDTSVLMNKLFRNIKENQNLDALEESDDDDEFENDSMDKYVYLDRSFIMNCKFNYKFKKWMPISIANTREHVINYNLLVNKI
jgi:hypothetical protein